MGVMPVCNLLRGSLGPGSHPRSGEVGGCRPLSLGRCSLYRVRSETQRSQALCCMSPGPPALTLGQALGARGKGGGSHRPSPVCGIWESGWGQEPGSWTRKAAKKLVCAPPSLALQPAGRSRPKGQLHAPTALSGFGGCRPVLSAQPGGSVCWREPGVLFLRNRHRMSLCTMLTVFVGLAVACLGLREPCLGGPMGWGPLPFSVTQAGNV